MVMDIFTLAPQPNRWPGHVEYDPDITIQGWSSLIWTERYQDFGDFKLVHSDPTYAWKTMPVGTLLGLNASNEVMMVENHEIKFSKDRGPVVEVSGRSILAMLEYRIFVWNKDQYKDDDRWGYGNLDEIGYTNKNLTDIPGHIYWLVKYYGAEKGMHIYDDKAAELPIRAVNDIGKRPELSITDFKQAVGTVWEGIKKLLIDYHWGMRVDRVTATPPRGVPNQFNFTLYEGSDLSNSVIFSEDNNTLISSQRLRSDKGYINRVFVTRKTTADWFYDFHMLRNKYSDGVAGTYTGFNYRAGFMNAPSNETGNLGRLRPELTAYFLEHQKRDILSGEVAPSNVYEYRRDYYIGDKVAFKSQDGSLTNMWVKEFIYSEDENGFKQYPTFESEL